jgi:5-methyltetrahydrofolate--homocysteine methyltransferase
MSALTLESLLNQRILVMDGGIGTMIKSYRLEEADFRGERFANHKLDLVGNNDLLSITQPNIITEIHTAFLDAGSDIIETNTFNATSISQVDYGLEKIVYELNYEATKIARKAADRQTRKTPKKPRFVAGSLGPTNQTASLSPDCHDPSYRTINFDVLVTAYTEALHGLIKGGVDLLLIETIFDTLNSKAAIYAIQEYFENHSLSLPIMISGTITDASGKTLSGQVPEAFWISVAHSKPISIGFNCALGADELHHHIQTISDLVNVNVSVYPNAGHPNEFGEYDHTPQHMASLICEFAESGLVNIVGGCCGSTPDHIRAIARAVSNKPPRLLPETLPYCQLSGLEPLNCNKWQGIICVEGLTNVSESTKFMELIRENKFIEALDIIQDQVRNGAQIIKIKIDDDKRDGEKLITRILNLISADPEISRLPVMLDSSKFSIIRAGLKCLQGKCMVNSISLKEGKKNLIANASEIHRYGAAVVVIAIDEDGPADTYERMITIFHRTYKLLTKTIGFTPENIIFDINISPIANDFKEDKVLSRDIIKVVEKIKKVLPHVMFKQNNKIFLNCSN